MMPPRRLLTILAGVLVVRVTIGVVGGYRGYLPPDFHVDFLRGRERDFLGAYPWPFYVHILSGPWTLLLGLFLVHERMRTRFPKWHRHLGKAQVACVLLLVTPSGLWMAFYSRAGPIATAGLAGQALATAACAAVGARAAAGRRFTAHRRWMWRCYLLLCSAVVLRLLGGLATVIGLTVAWFDPLAIWTSWLLPVAVFELRERWWSRPGGLTSARAGAA